MPRQNPRVQYTRDALRCALLELLLEKPVKHITVTDVCARAGINRSTFYLHYKDVYDLLEQMENDLIDEMGRTFSTQPSASLQGHIEAMLCVVQARRPLCLAILSEHGNPQFVKQLGRLTREGFLQHWRSLFPQAPERLLELVYAFSTSGASAVIEQWLLADCNEPPEQIAHLLSLFAASCLNSCKTMLDS
ncbi:TetR/AcrR family transcriptional regulator [Agathobaculum sp.]|uniref:TetR/AcrR family transcriptional regulator n=1 Tax=Agathobaculum sp. TaxID=2048138 RepID=UPI002A80B0AB|nr:TetR/AcrR family transcriptional regulator C-terminal domain-containing protein [Agathobaculum sp.]MDY3617864.1 TetR/AcrR family transcriptional regulator C-terminal domain-containing protein [Agathobaculum sp.]